MRLLSDDEDASSDHDVLLQPAQSIRVDRSSSLQQYPTVVDGFTLSSDAGSTGKGILIGMLSAFSSAAFLAVVFAIFYFFRYTRNGRIFLDRIGRPGEFDDEQAFAREEAQALEQMDDLQRTEYLRAKGTFEASMQSSGREREREREREMGANVM